METAKYVELIAHCFDKDKDVIKKMKERCKNLLPLTKTFLLSMHKEIEKQDLDKEERIQCYKFEHSVR